MSLELKTEEVIAASQEAVWDALTKFRKFENQIRERGIPVTRKKTERGPQWTVEVPLAGAPRMVKVHVEERRGPTFLHMQMAGSGLAGDMRVTLSPEGDARTKMAIEVALKGTTIAGKAIVGGLRVGQSQIQKKFEARVRTMVEVMAKQAQKSA